MKAKDLKKLLDSFPDDAEVYYRLGTNDIGEVVDISLVSVRKGEQTGAIYLTDELEEEEK